jgi:hypothetical protein
VAREKPNFGLAVTEDGKLRYTSVSSIQQFDASTYGGCERRWWWNKVARKKEPETPAMRRGTELHGELEHYLTTNECTLSPITMVGRHLLPRPDKDLFVEQALGDSAKALALRDEHLRRGTPPDNSEMESIAGLSAAGVPFVGFIDLLHARGEYVDGEGDVVAENDPATAEAVDHKTSTDIVRAKKPTELRTNLQMIGYGVTAANRYKNLRWSRLSHITYQTRGARVAKKTTVLVPVEEVRSVWRERATPLVRKMIVTASISRVEDVTPNTDSCNAYGGTCPHSAYCDRPKGTLADLLQLSKGAHVSKGLFDIPTASSNGVATAPALPAGLFAPAQVSPPPPPVPVATPDERQAAIAAARALLAAEDAAAAAPAPAPVVALGFCSACGTSLSAMNTSKLKDGGVFHVGCAALAPPPPVIAMPHIGAVNPPDALPATQAQIAATLSPEVIAKITDPEIKSRAEAHAVAAAAAPVAAGTKEKTSGRCLFVGQTIEITADDILAQRKKWPCPKCSKEMKLKPEKNPAGGFVGMFASHNMVGIVAPTPVVAVEAPVAAPAPTPPPVVLAPAVPSDTTPNIFIVGADGSRRKLTQEEIDGVPTPPAIVAPVPPPVAQAATVPAATAMSLWQEGKYEASSSFSLVLIAEYLRIIANK